MYAPSNQTGLAMYLVAGEGTVAAADAFGHVHDQKVLSIDNSRVDLTARRT
jgi:hypothetical protein